MPYYDDFIGDAVKSKLKSCSKNVRIYPLAKIAKPESVEIGECSMIDDFTFINGGKSTIIGRYVHISAFASITGGGELVVGDYSVLAAGSRILTGTDTYYGGKRMSTALPIEQRNLIRGRITIGEDAFVGVNSVIHPNVEIGEGAVIGSCSLVTKNIEPWSINVGCPCRKIGDRPRITVNDL